MARAKSIAAKKHRKIKKAAKGFRHARSRRVKSASEAVLHAGQHAFIGRKLKKRDLRSLWIKRINAAAREHDMSYSQFMAELKKNNIFINRKMLADIAVNDSQAFEELVKAVK